MGHVDGDEVESRLFGRTSGIADSGCRDVVYDRAVKRIFVLLLAPLALVGCTASVGQTTQTVTVTSTVQESVDKLFLAEAGVLDDDFKTAPEQAIDLAKSICSKIEDGGDRVAIAKVLFNGYSPETATRFFHLSIAAYCPDQLAG